MNLTDGWGSGSVFGMSRFSGPQPGYKDHGNKGAQRRKKELRRDHAEIRNAMYQEGLQREREADAASTADSEAPAKKGGRRNKSSS